MNDVKLHIMEKIIVNVAWCDKNFGGSLGSNVPGAGGVQHQPLKLCKKKQRKVWSFMLKVFLKMVKMFQNG